MAIRLLRGRVAVRETTLGTYGGTLYVPQANARDIKAHFGRVLGFGPPAQTKKGYEIPPDFTVGSEVMVVYGLAGTEKDVRRGVWVDGEPCIYIAQEEVIGVVDV